MRKLVLVVVLAVSACGRTVTGPSAQECLAFHADTMRSDTGAILAIVASCPKR